MGVKRCGLLMLIQPTSGLMRKHVSKSSTCLLWMQNLCGGGNGVGYTN